MKKALLFGVLFLLVLAGLFFYSQYVALQNGLKVGIQKFKINNIAWKDLNIDLTLVITNPSYLSVNIIGISGTLSLNNRHIGDVNTKSIYPIAPQGSSSVTINIQVDPSATIDANDLANLMGGVLNLTGYAEIGWSFYSMRIPLTYSATVGSLL